MELLEILLSLGHLTFFCIIIFVMDIEGDESLLLDYQNKEQEYR